VVEEITDISLSLLFSAALTTWHFRSNCPVEQLHIPQIVLLMPPGSIGTLALSEKSLASNGTFIRVSIVFS
jgi:hypothetical protein